MRPGASPAYAAPKMYRTRRRVLRRLVIPGILAAIVVGAAIGAAASYLTTRGNAVPQRAPAKHAAPSTRAASSSPPGTTAKGPGNTSPRAPAGTTAPPPSPAGAAADGRVLNDQGYALVQRGEYDAAIPPLRQAVADLRGAGPADPYEAYANYNLGYALLQVGDCADALPPLEVANRLETSPLVDAAIRRAESCGKQGS